MVPGLRILMTNQSMGTHSIFESDTQANQMEQVGRDIDRLEKEVTTASKFKALYDSVEFQSVIVDELLSKHATEQANRLTQLHLSSEVEQEILVELRALRYLHKLLELKRAKADNVEGSLKASKQLLLDLQSGTEDN